MKKRGDQVKLLVKAKKELGYSNLELAQALGKSETTVKSWLAPVGAIKRREMPESAKLLLAHLLAAKMKK